MRGEQVQGRFTINHERGSLIAGTTKEIVRTVGHVVDWYLYDQDNTIVDEIYDVGGDSFGTGGRRWKGPFKVPVINGTVVQGATIQSEEGFYNTDVLTLTINMDAIDGSNEVEGEHLTLRPLRFLPTNPDSFLRDRVIFRQTVWKFQQIEPRGIMNNKYTLFDITCYQVNPEELVNDVQFIEYANYSPFTPNE